MTDFSNMSLEEIQKQIEELSKLATQRKQASFDEGIAAVKEVMQKFSLTADDLIKAGIVVVKTETAEKSHFFEHNGKKYGNLERGKRPEILLKAMKFQGVKLADILINKTDENIAYANRKEEEIKKTEKYKTLAA
ncbi:hypothetical protein PQU95_02580 [Vogesella sp. DC21W]|uniref:DNA-binding protein H-NS n=1 Tax=Vogesella aquatica TaxID=2984206 RepID=A0ABT5IU96_9NEIS|nr:H-NS family nucleoid-associated regulatory protein [Vogesella aquatica]MDC7716109.1 hypothetical protein [Vogesella aquatica]